MQPMQTVGYIVRLLPILLLLSIASCCDYSEQQNLESRLEDIQYQLDEVRSQMSSLEDELSSLEGEISDFSYEDWSVNVPDVIDQFDIVLSTAYDLQSAIDALPREGRNRRRTR